MTRVTIAIFHGLLKEDRFGRRTSVGHTGRHDEGMETTGLCNRTRRVNRELHFGDKPGLGNCGGQGPGHGADQTLFLRSRTVVIEGDDNDRKQEIEGEDKE